MAFRILGPHELTHKDLSDKESAILVRCVNKLKSLEILGDKEEVRALARGAYVFAIRNQHEAGKPWYVGITKKKTPGSLYQEALHNDKLRKYALAFAEEDYSGTALLFFLVPGGGKADNIDKLEAFLIWLARQRNPSLLNKQKRGLSPAALQEHLQKHQIDGILNGNRGKPTDGARDFRKMIGWYRHMQVGPKA